MKVGPAPDIVRTLARFSLSFSCYCALSCIRSLPVRGLRARGVWPLAPREILLQRRSHPPEFAGKTLGQLRYKVLRQSGSAIPAVNQDCFQPNIPAAAFVWPL